jgi:hypothetical protein
VTQPRTGQINREWVIETFPGVVYTAGGVVISSQKLAEVDEAYFLSGIAAGSVIPTGATIISHGARVPDQGSVSATVAATLGPQQFLVGLYDAAGELAASTLTALTFIERGA